MPVLPKSGAMMLSPAFTGTEIVEVHAGIGAVKLHPVTVMSPPVSPGYVPCKGAVCDQNGCNSSLRVTICGVVPKPLTVNVVQPESSVVCFTVEPSPVVFTASIVQPDSSGSAPSWMPLSLTSQNLQAVTVAVVQLSVHCFTFTLKLSVLLLSLQKPKFAQLMGS